MEDLLTQYSITEFLVFIVILALAIKEAVSFIDWACGRIRKVTDKDYEAKEEQKEIEDKIGGLEKFYAEKERVDKGFEEIHAEIQKMNARIDMLIVSDKEDIKSSITDKHHFFCQEQGWIDDYSMECLENRFAVYQKEHGNSFVETFMEDLRRLPRKPPEKESIA